VKSAELQGLTNMSGDLVEEEQHCVLDSHNYENMATHSNRF